MHVVVDNGILATLTIVILVAHNLHLAVLIANCQHGPIAIVSWAPTKPTDAGNALHTTGRAAGQRQALDAQLHLTIQEEIRIIFDFMQSLTHCKVALIVVEMTLAVDQGKEYETIVGTPLYATEMRVLQFLAKYAIAIDGANNNSAILIYNTDLSTIRCPGHAGHSGFLAIIGHFLVPRILVQHPDHNNAVCVRGGQLLLCIIPGDHSNRTLVAIQSLIHRKIRNGRQSSFALAIVGS